MTPPIFERYTYILPQVRGHFAVVKAYSNLKRRNLTPLSSIMHQNVSLTHHLSMQKWQFNAFKGRALSLILMGMISHVQKIFYRDLEEGVSKGNDVQYFM